LTSEERERKQPLCSIIVPTRRRPNELVECLEALCRLEYPGFEVVVVDDEGGIDLRSLVDTFEDRIALTLHSQKRTGPAGARNAGATRAAGELLAFTDDDCRPAADWLLRLVHAVASDPAAGAGGHTVNALVRNLYASTSQLVIDVGYEQNNGDLGAARFFTSNNLLVPAAAFAELGGFDETFTTSEDRDFCDRWVSRGFSLRYVPGAIVYHAHDLTLKSFIRQQFAYGRGAARYHKAHARRWNRRVTIEPSFYAKLFLSPFRLSKGRRALQQSLLLQVWNVVNLVGFLYERARGIRGRIGPAASSPSIRQDLSRD
jgi:GT2 family glycosyltransferase